MAHHGFPRTPIQVTEAVKMYLDKSGIKVKEFSDNHTGKTWFSGFLCRHPGIKLAKTEKLEQSHAQRTVYNAWFDSFENFCIENGINSADQIYNGDESGFPLQAGT